MPEDQKEKTQQEKEEDPALKIMSTYVREQLNRIHEKVEVRRDLIFTFSLSVFAGISISFFASSAIQMFNVSLNVIFTISLLALFLILFIIWEMDKKISEYEKTIRELSSPENIEKISENLLNSIARKENREAVKTVAIKPKDK